MNSSTYYDTLQVSRYASASVIRAAYKALSQKHHPDKHPGNVDVAHRNMQRLNEAFQVLSDPERKRSYDLVLSSMSGDAQSNVMRDATAQQEARAASAERARAEEEIRAAANASTKRSYSQRTSESAFKAGDGRSSDENSTVPPGRYSYSQTSERSRSNGIFAGVPKVLFLAVVVGLGFVAFEKLQGRAPTTPVSRTHVVRGASPLASAPSPIPEGPQPDSPYPWCSYATDRATCEMHAARKALATAEPEAPYPKRKPIASESKQRQGLPFGESDEVIRPAAVAVLPRRVRDLSCMSTVTLRVNSTNYAGAILIDLRRGSRPGSSLLEQFKVVSSGVVTATNVCPGTYFFAFATQDAEAVSTTRYFPVEQSETQYSTPEITVTYTRASSQPGSQAVGVALRTSL